jgi:hypothetical protein
VTNRNGFLSLAAMPLGLSSVFFLLGCQAMGLRTVYVAIVLSRNGYQMSDVELSRATRCAPGTEMVIPESKGEFEAPEVYESELWRGVEGC